MYYNRMWTRESNVPAVKRLKDGVWMWAKDNEEGCPAIRWTSPKGGRFNINGSFRGEDKSFAEVVAYVVVNGVVVFEGKVTKGEALGFNVKDVPIQTEGKIDFIIMWGGAGDAAGNWTKIDGVVRRIGP
jgi:hypothetical protein